MNCRRLAGAVAALALLAAVASGCASGSQGTTSANTAAAGGVIPLLRVGTTFSEATLDVTKNTGASIIDNLSLETLLTLGPNAQLEPSLATSVTQPNPVTYVYHLRHGVKFWNGDPLTATDVAYSLNYVRAPGSQAAYVFPPVKSITADGPYTVVVTLPGPDPAWKYTPALTFTGIFEAKFAEEHKNTFGKPGTLIMGSGPWEVDSLDPTSGAELSANPHWWGGKVPIKNISVKVYSSETSLALAFRAGEVDLAPEIVDARSFASTSGVTLLSTPSCQDGFLTMNTQTPPWNNIDVRRAVAYALNRSDIIAAEGGYATPLYTFIPPAALETVASKAQVGQLLDSVNLYPYNLAKAKQEMAQSPYPHGVSATLQVYEFDNLTNVAQVEAAELAKIGINVSIKAVTLASAEATGTGPAGKRPTSAWSGGCIDPDVSGYDFYLGSSNTQAGEWNEADWAPPAVDSMLTQGTTNDNPAVRFQAFSGIVKQMAADVPYVPLYLHEVSIALSSKFTDPGYNYWYFLDNDYALGIKAAK
jgi:peptide/nickel transport system substrate-binding protein